MKIFDAQTINASSGGHHMSSDIAAVYCYGAFNGATVELQMSPDGAEWFTLPELTFTEKTLINVRLPRKSVIRGVISSAGASTSITLDVR